MNKHSTSFGGEGLTLSPRVCLAAVEDSTVPSLLPTYCSDFHGLLTTFSCLTVGSTTSFWSLQVI